MTIASETRKSPVYEGNGVTTSFAYTWRITNQAYLRVTVSDEEGVETELELTTDYTVTGVNAASGGNVVLNTALADGYQLVIESDSPYTQETGFRNQGSFLPQAHEESFDKLTRLAQQNHDMAESALRPKPTDADALDAKDRRIVNLADGEDDEDAVNLGQVERMVDGAIGASAGVAPRKWSLTGDGAETEFEIEDADVASALFYDVAIDGAVQDPNVDFTISLSGTPTITFNPAPGNGAKIVVVLRGYAKGAQTDAEQLRADLASTADGYGAALVGFKADTASASARIVAGKLQERKSVLDYAPSEAVRNAIRARTSTDDHSSWVQQALNENRGVHFPYGLYNIASLLPHDDLMVTGDGKNAVTLKILALTNSGWDVSNCDRVTLSGFEITHDTSSYDVALGGVGITGNTFTRLDLLDLRLRDMTKQAISIGGTDLIVRGLEMRKIGRGGLVCTGVTRGVIADFVIDETGDDAIALNDLSSGFSVGNGHIYRAGLIAGMNQGAAIKIHHQDVALTNIVIDSFYTNGIDIKQNNGGTSAPGGITIGSGIIIKNPNAAADGCITVEDLAGLLVIDGPVLDGYNGATKEPGIIFQGAQGGNIVVQNVTARRVATIVTMGNSFVTAHIRNCKAYDSARLLRQNATSSKAGKYYLDDNYLNGDSSVAEAVSFQASGSGIEELHAEGNRYSGVSTNAYDFGSRALNEVTIDDNSGTLTQVNGTSGVTTLRRINRGNGRVQRAWGADYDSPKTLTDGDTSPSLKEGKTFQFANTGATTVTTFDDMVSGQHCLIRLDANTTISGATIKTPTGGDITGTADDILQVVMFGSTLYAWVQTLT